MGFYSEEAYKVKIAYLQPMSGLASREDKYTPGSIDVKIGEGKTADVLRNICYQLLNPERSLGLSLNDKIIQKNWDALLGHIKRMFGITLNKPRFIAERGEIEMDYVENGITFDLSSSGTGFLQVFLLLAYLYSNPKCVLLLDEPDAHLEVIRQREVYSTLSEVARDLDCQVILASHSEIILNEAGDRDFVVA